MSTISNIIQAISWTLVHSLWFGLIMIVFAGLVILFTRRSVPAVRYNLFTALLFMFIAACTVTFINALSGENFSDSSGIVPAYDVDKRLGSMSMVTAAYSNLILFLQQYGQPLVFVWMAVMTWKFRGMWRATKKVRTLRSQHIIIPTQELTDRVAYLAKKLGIRKVVSIMESAVINIPVVIGHLKPVILLPVGVTTNLTIGEVEAILLHELAHIRRNDYLINIMQCVGEMIFFFNPGMLWVSSLMRRERENCCDEIAINATNNKLQFVEALIHFKEYSISKNQYAMGLFSRKNLLLHRVRRIVEAENASLAGREKIIFTLSMGMCLFLFSIFYKSDVSAPKIAVQQQVQAMNSQYHPDIPANVHLVYRAKSTTQQGNGKPVSKKPAVVKARDASRTMNKIITPSAESRDIVMADERGRLEQNESKADKDRRRAEESRIAAERDRVQADRDREVAERDRVQAEKDRVQADKDRQRADRDRLAAEKDRLQAEKDRLNAEKDRQQADRDREAANKDRGTLNKTTA